MGAYCLIEGNANGEMIKLEQPVKEERGRQLMLGEKCKFGVKKAGAIAKMY